VPGAEVKAVPDNARANTSAMAGRLMDKRFIDVAAFWVKMRSKL